MVNQKKLTPKVSQALSEGDTINLSGCEYIFVNSRKDSLDDIDLSAVIDEAEITCTEQEVEVVTSPITDVINPSEADTNSPSDVKTGGDHAYSSKSSDVNTGKEVTEDKSVEAAPSTSTDDRKDINTTNMDTLEHVENELQCIICTELFVKATTLNCSHSFCKYCIEQWRNKNKNCPICRTKITTANPTIVLDNFIEKVLESSPEDVKQKRNELIKSREQQLKVAPIKINVSRITRAPSPVEISSDDDDEDSSFSDENTDEDMDSDYNGIPGRYYGGYGHCYSCGDTGHWANGCPYR